MKLEIYNEMIYNKYHLIKTEHFSAPLLVSPDQEKHNPKIMYIGQETNTWGSGFESTEELENKYKDFLLNGATGKDYWKFIKDLISIDKSKIYENILWTNTLLAGSLDKKGLPQEHQLLFNISVEYLVILYKVFKPSKVVIVSGPSNPYYSIINEFLTKIDNPIDVYPTMNNPVIISDNKHIYWTYHPNFLNKKGLKSKVLTKIRENY